MVSSLHIATFMCVTDREKSEQVMVRIPQFSTVMV